MKIDWYDAKRIIVGLIGYNIFFVVSLLVFHEDYFVAVADGFAGFLIVQVSEVLRNSFSDVSCSC